MPKREREDDDNLEKTYIGRRVTKFFFPKYWNGEVRECIPKEDCADGEGPLYHIVYEDEDEEDMNTTELREALSLYKEMRKKARVAKAKKAVDDKVGGGLLAAANNAKSTAPTAAPTASPMAAPTAAPMAAPSAVAMASKSPKSPEPPKYHQAALEDLQFKLDPKDEDFETAKGSKKGATARVPIKNRGGTGKGKGPRAG